MSKHVVHIAESGMVEIHRLEDDGSMILFTRMDSRTFDFSTFARLLGENLFLDSPEGRDLVRKPMTVEAFLAWEEEQDLRFELVDGHPYAMTGGTNAHDLVRVGIVSEFRQQLRNTPCRAQIDVKVVCPRGNVRYPDVQITCGPWDPRSSVAANPVVVVEVLSRSTQATDFIAKLADYESVASIKAYALFWQDEPRAQVFRREGGRLVLAEEVSGRDSGLAFTDPDVRLALADVYDGLPDAIETPTPV